MTGVTTDEGRNSKSVTEITGKVNFSQALTLLVFMLTNRYLLRVVKNYL